jgi:hypothetical protein
MTGSKEIWRKALKLAGAGGLAFWAANFATSLTPIAAKYRAAFLISYFPMTVAALIGGMVIGFCVSYFLLRFFGKIPTKNPILKSVILSFVVLAIILAFSTILYLGSAVPAFYILLNAGINVPRFLALGIVVGYLYDKFR